MKLILFAAGLAFFQTSLAVKLARGVANPQVVHFETNREIIISPNDLEKRDSTVLLTTYPDSNSRVRIVVNVTLGTPPQSLGLALDTGSADFVVRTTASSICAAGNCTDYGSFDPTKSSTFNDSKVVYQQSYGEGTTANGTLATDTISFAGITLNKFTIAACDHADITDNVFGVGFPGEEALSATINATPYRNGAFAMKDAGLIKTAAYSIWLNDAYSGSGSVLFGGVDTAKYTGALQTVPVVPQFIVNGTSIFGFAKVSLDAVGTTKGGITTLTTSAGFPISTILDTGTTSCILPQPIVDNLCSAFGCTVQGPYYLLPCTFQAPNSGNISFAFSGVNITVPVNQFVRQAGWPGGFCSFDIVPTNKSSGYILGDSFLRAVYAVYDLEAGEIALAQTVYNATGSSVVEITSGRLDGIPNSQNASNVRAGIPSGTGPIGPAVTVSRARKDTSIAAGVIIIAAVAFLWRL